MDETGHSGDTGSAESGAGADSRDRALLNGWATSDSAWSNAGSALDPEDDVPSWRRASPEIRPFTRQNFPPDRPAGEARPFGGPDPSTEVRPFGSPPNPFGDTSRSGDLRAFGDASQSGEVRPLSDGGGQFSDGGGPFSGGGSPFSDSGGEEHPFGDRSRSGEIRNFADSSQSGEIRPSADPVPPAGTPPASEPAAPQWSDPSRRYADLMHHFATGARPDSLEDDDRRTRPGPLDAPPPSSAPPYPYEGDLDDAPPAAPPVVQQRAAVPLERPQRPFPAVRPAVPDARRNDWSALSTGSWPAAEPARHAVAPTPPETTGGSSGEDTPARTPYDPATFPRRLRRDPAGSAPPAEPPPADATPTAFGGFADRSADEPGGTPIGDQTARALPQRVPAQPDVPTVPEPPSVEPPAETPALARIATHLRRGDVLSSQERQEGFDVNAILEAVREVDGVRDASLRSTPAGAHSLRLDLAEGADPAEVSRQVARLLQDRMGLDAAMQGGEQPARPGATATGSAQVPPVSAPPAPATPVAPAGSGPANTPPLSAFVPSQSGSAGRATVPSAGAASARGDDLRRLPTAPQAGPGSFGTRDSTITPAQISPAQVSPAQISPAQISTAQISPAAPVSPAQISPPAAPPESSPVSAVPVSPAVAAPVVQAAHAAPATSVAGGSVTATSPVTTDPAAGTGTGTVETVTSGVDCTPPRPLDIRERPGPRVTIENVQVNTFGTEATVEVRLAVGGRTAVGIASGPAVDGYLLRLCATATAGAVDDLLAGSDHSEGPARCYVEHAASVSFGSMQVAVVVLLLSCGGTWVEQLAGSAVMSGDDRHAMVRATLAAVNRRLEALLS